MTRKNITVMIGAVACVVVLAALAWAMGWLAPPQRPRSLVLSGNIEAHESVLSFKSVQSRIVELPFDEGQWVGLAVLWPQMLALLGIGTGLMALAILRFKKSLD